MIYNRTKIQDVCRYAHDMSGGVESKELQQLHLRAREQLHVATWKKEDGMPRKFNQLMFSFGACGGNAPQKIQSWNTTLIFFFGGVGRGSETWW